MPERLVGWHCVGIPLSQVNRLLNQGRPSTKDRCHDQGPNHDQRAQERETRYTKILSRIGINKEIKSIHRGLHIKSGEHIAVLRAPTNVAIPTSRPCLKDESAPFVFKGCSDTYKTCFADDIENKKGFVYPIL